MANYLNETDLDYFAIRNSLKQYFESHPNFRDYDFDGSNLNLLIGLLARNTHTNAFYLNQIGAELDISTATLRESVVNAAKSLNYLPKSRVSARAEIVVSVVPGDSPSSITVPEDYRFTTSIDGKTISFVTDRPHVITQSNGQYSTNTITIYEGEIVNEYFTANTSINENGYTQYNNRFILQSENIDTSSIKVFVRENANSVIETEYKLASDLYDVSSTDTVFFIYGYADNQYEIGFGNGVFGLGLNNTAKIRVKYRDTLGADGNLISQFSKSTSIQGYSSIVATTRAVSFGGAERESVESIKFTAPKFWQTQNRAVTYSDYATLVKSRFTQLQAVHAYGGEEKEQYGKVFIATKPYGSAGYISSSLKRQIEQFLKTKNTTMEPVVEDADYFNLSITSQIHYDPKKVIDSAEAIRNNVIQNLVNLNNTMLSTFDSDFRYSKTIKIIDDTSSAIKSNITTINMVKNWAPNTGKDISYKVSFGNELKSLGTLDNESANIIRNRPLSHPAVFYSNYFTVTYNGADYVVSLRDNGLGELYMMYTTENTGQLALLGGAVGTIDYATATAEFKIPYLKEYTTNIKLYAAPKRQDIFITQNRFIIVNADDISVTMVSDE